jgi:hypothetical protein
MGIQGRRAEEPEMDMDDIKSLLVIGFWAATVASFIALAVHFTN